MPRRYIKDNPEWRKRFGQLLKATLLAFDIDYNEYAEMYHISPSTMRYWFIGRNLPQRQFFRQIKYYLKNEITVSQEQSLAYHDALLSFFRSIHDEDSYYSLVRQNPDPARLAASALEELYVLSKNEDRFANSKQKYTPTGHTQIVVFDFDGTLAKERKNQTTWEVIWKTLWYSPEACKELHHQFDEGQITHGEWCAITQKKFMEKHLHRDTLDRIAKKIHLIKGVRATFVELQKRNIAIYIVSGSIMTVILKVLGSTNQYVQEIQANVFKFNQAGFLIEIVGTQFDFEGKARYITLLSEKHKISPQDILFVGNSINDRFAYRSGCRTLCVNPQLVDAYNKEVFNDCIPYMENLEDILQYIE